MLIPTDYRYAYTYIHKHIHTHTHIYTYTHTYTQALEKECNKKVYNRLQRLINMKIAKAFRTTSNGALCTLTGLTPIVIKVEEAAKLYSIMRKCQVQGIDYESTAKGLDTPSKHN
jgi:hypothetical protein